MSLLGLNISLFYVKSLTLRIVTLYLQPILLYALSFSLYLNTELLQHHVEIVNHV